jgi:hypothetical protein
VNSFGKKTSLRRRKNLALEEEKREKLSPPLLEGEDARRTFSLKWQDRACFFKFSYQNHTNKHK